MAVSFRSVFEREFGYVWKTLVRLGVREADVADQAQEVFIVVHGILSEYDTNRPLKPWLFGIAYRVAARYRSLRRNTHERVADEALEPSDESPGVESLLLGAEQRRFLLEALDGIDLPKRAVFVMSEIDERPMQEVADALQIPVNTAYSRLRHAREQFAAAAQRLRAREGDR